MNRTAIGFRISDNLWAVIELLLPTQVNKPHFGSGRPLHLSDRRCAPMHAYCISTHRSQGAEYTAVVIPLLTQHYMLLQRNLIYTAITRAKKMVVLVGSRKAVHMAVNNNKVAKRYTGLPVRLKGG